MEIIGATLEAKGAAFECEALELAEPRPGEVLVKIVGCGICHTDIVCRDQYFPVPMPCVLGHEGSGIVAAVGDGVTKVVPGDHVVLTYRSCGQCVNCRKGAHPYCLDLYGHNFAGLRPDGSTALSRHGEHVHGHFFSPE